MQIEKIISHITLSPLIYTVDPSLTFSLILKPTQSPKLKLKILTKFPPSSISLSHPNTLTLPLNLTLPLSLGVRATTTAAVVAVASHDGGQAAVR